MLAPKVNFTPDQFGFYTVGPDFKTYSKLAAIEEMARSGTHLDWNFNRAAFGSYNWTQEPAVPLAELYRQRAQQIRDSYDYVVVFYSGGADSWNILNTFISNDIKVDEIAHCWSLQGDNSYHSYFNEEIYRVAIPNTLRIQQQHPEINHRIIDISKIINSMYLGRDTQFDFIYQSNSLLSPNGLARSYLREQVKDYANMIAAGKRVAFVWGTEKPRLVIKDGKYVCQFVDIFDNTVSSRLQSLAVEQGYYDELFYWSPEAVPIVIKQCHIVKQFLTTSEVGNPWLSQQPTPYGKTKRHSQWLTNDGLHSLIYPGWDVNTFTNGKNNQTVIGPRDQWFWSQNEFANPGLKIFQQGIKKIFDTIGPYWYNVPTDWRRGLKGCINEYCIE
jgi:hypothetical protein